MTFTAIFLSLKHEPEASSRILAGKAASFRDISIHECRIYNLVMVLTYSHVQKEVCGRTQYCRGQLLQAHGWSPPLVAVGARFSAVHYCRYSPQLDWDALTLTRDINSSVLSDKL